MNARTNVRQDLHDARHRAASERERAVRAGALAQRHEQMAQRSPERMRRFHTRMAMTHRQIQQRHVTAAEMHAAYANKLRRWLGNPAGAESSRPVFMSAVAETSGSASATVTLFENGVTESLVATSDNTARTANELELVLGEGPTRESAAGGDLVYAGDAELRKRWPQCGPALAALDVRSVAAAPLRTHTSRLGTLTVFDPRPTVRSSDLAQLIETADALTDSVLLASAAAFDDGVPDLPLFNEAEQQVVTHQAAGMLSVQAGCDIADAFTLLCARAFATGERVEDVAHRVVNEGLRLT